MLISAGIVPLRDFCDAFVDVRSTHEYRLNPKALAERRRHPISWIDLGLHAIVGLAHEGYGG